MRICTRCGGLIEWVIDEGDPPFWCHIVYPADGHEPDLILEDD